MSGVKIKVRTFRTPADITAPGALDGVIDQATLFADTLYLEREGLPCNLSALAQRIIVLAPLASSDARSAAEIMARIGDINRLLAIWPILQQGKEKAFLNSKKMAWARKSRGAKHDWEAVAKTEQELYTAGRSQRDFAAIIQQRHGVPPTTYREWRRRKTTE